MIGSRTTDKTILLILSMVTGILLFLSSFTLMLSSTFFNSEFQKEAISKLGIGGYVSTLADEMSSGAGLLQNRTTPVFSDIVTSDFIDRNIQSLIDGLIQYFKGNTNTLPDILLPDLAYRSNVDDSFGINDEADSMLRQNTETEAIYETLESDSLLTYGYPEKINLNGVLMIFSEPRIADIMLVIKLFHFIFAQVPYLCLFMMIMFCTVMFYKSAAPDEIRIRIQLTAAVYSILSVSSGFLIQLLLYFKPPLYFSLPNIPSFISDGVLTGYITYCANYFSSKLVMSGFMVSGVLFSVIYILERSSRKAFSFSSDVLCYFEHVSPQADSSCAKDTGLMRQKATIVILLVITLMAVGMYSHFRAAYQDFSDRHLSRAVAFINGKEPYYQLVDARNDQVYLLHVKISDRITGHPVEGMTIRVFSRNDNNLEYVKYVTDSEGSAIFSLGQTDYKLMLYPTGPLSAYNLPEWLSYEFEMTKPGLEELQIALDMQPDGLTYIRETFMQYIP